jgi:hypothetical protein
VQPVSGSSYLARWGAVQVGCSAGGPGGCSTTTAQGAMEHPMLRCEKRCAKELGRTESKAINPLCQQKYAVLTPSAKQSLHQHVPAGNPPLPPPSRSRSLLTARHCPGTVPPVPAARLPPLQQGSSQSWPVGLMQWWQHQPCTPPHSFLQTPHSGSWHSWHYSS